LADKSPALMHIIFLKMLKNKISAKYFIIFIIVFLVSIMPLFVIYNYSVDLFSDDQIDGEIPYIIQKTTGENNGYDIFYLQLEHRMAAHRLIGSLIQKLPQWEYCYYIIFKYICCFISSLIICHIFTKNTTNFNNDVFIFSCVSSFIIFGLQQIEVWTNPMNEHNFIISCLVFGVLICCSSFKFKYIYSACILLAVFCSFTFSSGLTSWFILYISLFLSPIIVINNKWLYSLLWWVIFAIVLIFYFHDYSSPADSPGIGPALESPARALLFYFCALGSPLAIGTSIPSIPLAFGLGLILFVSYSFFVCLYLKNKIADSGKKFIQAIFPWLVLGLLPLINIGLTAIGRSGFGIEIALASRYGTAANLLIICVMALAMITFSSGLALQQSGVLKKSSISTNPNPFGSVFFLSKLAWFPTAFITLVCILQLCATFYIFPHYEMMRHLKTNAKAATLFSEFIIDRDLLGPLWRHPTMEPFLKRIDFMDKNGLLRPNRPKTNLINKIIDKRYFSDQELRDLGAMEGASRIDEQRVVINGWALESNGKRPADAILLTIRNPNGDDELVGFARIGFERNDLASAKGSKKYFRSGWQKVVEIETLKRSSNGNRMKAWAYDTTTGFSRPLAGEMSIQ
jgi:hypothetical protein